MLRYILIILFFISNGLSAFSQNNNPLRIEVESNKIEDIYSLPIESKHLLVLEHLRKRAPKGEHWILEVFNKQMKKIGNKDLFLPRDFELFDHKLLGDTIIWLCFAEPDGDNSSMMLYRLDLKTMFMRHIYIKGSRKAKLDRIEVLNNKLFIIGDNLKEIKSQVENVKLPSGIQLITVIIPEHSQIIDSKSDEKNNRVVIIINGRKEPNKGLYYFEFTEDGDSFSKTKLIVSEKGNIVDGRLIETNTRDLLFMGTYSTHYSRQSSKRNIPVEGVYFGKISNKKFVFFNINKFSEFRNVYSTLDYRTAIKAKQKQSNGKDVNLAFKLLIHEKYFKQGNNYVMVAESYYPEYHYENNFDSRGYMYQTQVFDGYKTSNCIVAAFSETGDLLWDNYMHINNIRSYSLQENILTFPEVDSSIVIAYYFDAHIVSKSVKGNDVVFKKTEEKIETIQENVISEELGNIQAWYGKYFIVSGHQIIIGKNSKKRKVYFFNLVSFD